VVPVLDVASAGVPVTAWSVDADRGRHELRTVQVLPAPPELNFPHVAQVFLIERKLLQLLPG